MVAQDGSKLRAVRGKNKIIFIVLRAHTFINVFTGCMFGFCQYRYHKSSQILDTGPWDGKTIRFYSSLPLRPERKNRRDSRLPLLHFTGFFLPWRRNYSARPEKEGATWERRRCGNLRILSHSALPCEAVTAGCPEAGGRKTEEDEEMSGGRLPVETCREFSLCQYFSNNKMCCASGRNGSCPCFASSLIIKRAISCIHSDSGVGFPENLHFQMVFPKKKKKDEAQHQ